MLHIRKQEIGDISNSTVIAINGDVTIDGEKYNTLLQTLVEVVRKDFEQFSSIAISNAKEELSNFLKQIFKKLARDGQIHLAEKFQKPSCQIGLHDSLISYMSSEDDNVKEYIVDTMIDRLKAESGTTEQAIVSEAIKLIPNLNRTTLSLLALMNLRHQIMLPPVSFILESSFAELSPIVNQAPQISNMDIDFISQNKCTRAITGLYPIDTLENHLLKQYDLYFRREGSKEELDAFAATHPEIMYQVNDMGTCMFCYTHNDLEHWKFSDVNSKVFYDRLRARGQEYLIHLVEELKSKLVSFTQSEVREYLCKINPNWMAVFNLLNSPQLNHTDLSMLGMYIGSKYISKVTKKPSLPILSLANPISL